MPLHFKSPNYYANYNTMDNPQDLSTVDRSPSKNDIIFNPKKSNTFWVLLREANNQIPTFEKELASDYLYRISLSSGREQVVRCLFELNDNYLFCYRESTKTLVAYLDLEYAKIKEIQQTMNGVTYYGIRIIKNKNYEDILSDNEQHAKNWFNLFKRFCIMSQFGMAYENVKVLGQGNFAKVFLVKRKSDDHLFAAKVFDKKAISADEMEKKCLIYEVNTLRMLDHPNVMKLHELYEGQNYVYCVTEAYLGGHLLQRILKKPNGRFSEKESLEIIFRILKGLSYLEGKDIIHRDLKPENIIFRDNEDPYEVVIVDFGFATKVADYKNLFTRCGTPGYVAPEVLNDFPYNTKADVFSAGIIFYILLTGCAPFYGDEYDDVVDKNLKADLNFNFEEIGLKFEPNTLDLLKSLLKKMPKTRISASEALNHTAFRMIDSHQKAPEDDQVLEGAGIQNLAQFHERYKFNIKGFPKPQAVGNNIPDNIAELNTPMLSADHRVLKQVPTAAMAAVGLTPMLQSKSDGPKTQMDAFGKKTPILKEIKEEKDEDDKKKAKAASNVKNALKGL